MLRNEPCTWSSQKPFLQSRSLPGRRSLKFLWSLGQNKMRNAPKSFNFPFYFRLSVQAPDNSGLFYKKMQRLLQNRPLVSENFRPGFVRSWSNRNLDDASFFSSTRSKFKLLDQDEDNNGAFHDLLRQKILRRRILRQTYDRTDKKKRSLQRKTLKMKGEGAHSAMDCILASNPAALGSILGIPNNFSLDLAD